MDIKQKSSILVILIYCMGILASPNMAYADLPKSGRYKLSRPLIDMAFRKYENECGNDVFWNPNEDLNNFIFLSPPLREIAKTVDIDSIIPAEKREFYVAKYDTVPGDSFYRLIDFIPLKIEHIPLESYGYICLKESIDSEFLSKCVDNDTIISIRRFIDLSPAKIDKFSETVAYFSTCDSILETEKGVNKNTENIHSCRELYSAIKSWNVERLKSLIIGDYAAIDSFDVMFFSRAIYQNKHMMEYSAYFSLFHECRFDDEDW